MKEVRRTESFTYNIRQESVPGLTEGQYRQLLEAGQASVEDDTASYLMDREFATIEKKEE